MPVHRVTCVVPTWDTLWDVYASARRVFVASPWISTEGARFLEKVRSNIPCDDWEIWTRIDVLDHVLGYSDYASLLEVLGKLPPESVTLRAGKILHAKVFWNGDHRALIGSCNLTGGGFGSNLEVGVIIEGEPRHLETILDQHRTRLVPLSLDDLREFVRSLEGTKNLQHRWQSLRDEVANIQLQKGRKKEREPPYFGIR